MKRQAEVKVVHDSPLWIYYKGVIQCFACGWWQNADTRDTAERLFANHICLPSGDSVAQYRGDLDIDSRR